MRLLDTLKRLLPFLVIIACLFGSYSIQNRMNTIRIEEKLVDTDIADNAPPVVVFTTVALGSFRGVIADLLWLYSDRMKEEGNYFEMYQLASWMVKLQPRFTGATAYLAWNMAYNISVTFSTNEERWRWVQRGIELIRDEGLVYNPGDPELYKELGWIYQHKMGMELDDSNRYYKMKLAEEMTMVLGGYPVDWEAFANAPKNEKELQERLGTDVSLDKRLEPVGSFKNLERLFVSTAGTLPESLQESLSPDQLRLLELCLRSRWLRNRLKLDPQFIQELDDKYGDLDWRLPEAHAIYWASLGLNNTDVVVNASCERMITQSLGNAFRGGRLAYAGSLEEFEVTPNISVVDAVNQQYLDTIENQGGSQSFISGYRNWLIDATVILYAFGAEKKAAEYYRKLQAYSTDPKHRVPLENFVLREMAGDVATATFDQAHALVQGFLFQGFRALAVGTEERARVFDLMATRIWEKYSASIGEGRSHERRKLPPLKDMRATMYQRCMEQFPPDLKAALKAEMGARKNDAGAQK